MSVSDTLNLAADLIEERGWATGNCGMQVAGPTCLEGALAASAEVETLICDQHPVVDGDAEVGAEIYSYAAVEAEPAYVALLGYLGRRPYVWNDDEGRTATEVVEVLRATALIEAARERETAAVTR